MGFEAEEKVRSEVFKPYQVNRKLMALAARDSISCTACPPIAVTKSPNEILDGSRSVVLDQSENRMYVQKANPAHALSLDFRLNEIVLS